ARPGARGRRHPGDPRDLAYARARADRRCGAHRPGARGPSRVNPRSTPAAMLRSAVRYWDAVFAFLVAMALAAALTPSAAALAQRLGAVAQPSERGLAQRQTPLLGGLAILAGVLLAATLWMPAT